MMKKPIQIKVKEGSPMGKILAESFKRKKEFREEVKREAAIKLYAAQLNQYYSHIIENK